MLYTSNAIYKDLNQALRVLASIGGFFRPYGFLEGFRKGSTNAYDEGFRDRV